MADLIEQLDPERIRSNFAEVSARVAVATAKSGRSPGSVEILTAVKYVSLEEMGALAEAGITLVGENRAQELVKKRDAYPDLFTWDFIGQLQSRKVRQLLPCVRLIHSVASDSALRELEKWGSDSTEVLVEVNISGEKSKGGIEPAQLASFIERCAVRVVGLMTMPPHSEDPEHSRPYFAALRELADRHGLARLSMGTTQDYEVAVEEGATIVRLGSTLLR